MAGGPNHLQQVIWKIELLPLHDKFHRYAKIIPLPVLMANNSSERVYLTLNIPSSSNMSTDICTYVEEEPPTDKINPLEDSDIFKNGRIWDFGYIFWIKLPNNCQI